ncbi:unnamed protein product [Adineta steineri]|uniref:Uncharacterized protein n=1 Tax=Adineta steineri TaxID=433720 RepID=A0A814AV58_9BILA|nr:unnamed protein product [Adineta steineri]CAF4033371.1 unnamed protein product [Adineta steineri]
MVQQQNELPTFDDIITAIKVASAVNGISSAAHGAVEDTGRLGDAAVALAGDIHDLVTYAGDAGAIVGGKITDDAVAAYDDVSDFFDHLFRRTFDRRRIIY